MSFTKILEDSLIPEVSQESTGLSLPLPLSTSPRWTSQQLAFIEKVSKTQDSIRLDAVAGSGKTTTLLEASRKMSGHLNVIALAFNKNIADELQKKFPKHVTCKTLNSVGHGVWMKASGAKLKLDPKKMGVLVTSWVKDNLGPEEGDDVWMNIRTVVSTAKSSGLIPPQWEAKLQRPTGVISKEVIEEICERNDIGYIDLYYHAALSIMLNSISEAFTSRIDFDDQIFMSTYFAADSFWPKYDVVMVDEAQDLSPMQHDMIERLGAKSRLIVVGDERQAIYGWRGASCHSLNELEARFGLIRMPLTESFRCPVTIIKQAQAIVPHITSSKAGGVVEEWGSPKKTQEDKEGWTTDQFKLGSVILCRNNAPLIKIGFALIRKNIPCYFTGADLAKGMKKIVQDLPPGGNTIDHLQSWYDTEIEKLMSKKKYEWMDKVTDRYEALCAIYYGSGALDKRTLLLGIDKLFLRAPSAGAIELSTIHKSKGKEWRTVYFLNQHLIPGRWIAEAAAKGVPGSEDLLLQEHNLRYVAITRALDSLIYFTLNKDDEVFSTDELPKGDE